MTEILQAILLGIVEGLTEFLPVSSTGHLIITGHLIGFVGDKAETFEVFIQLGAILAVLLLYKDRFLGLIPSRKQDETNRFFGVNGLVLLAITTLPALIFGVLLHGYIKRYLFNPMTVALGLAMGGGVILWVERKAYPAQRIGLSSLTLRDALMIGCFQSLAIWPGVSRSGATIIGGMLLGIERKTAVEYSFLAAVPVMFAATSYDLYKTFALLSSSDYLIFSVGFGTSFISAMIAIRFFIKWLSRVTLWPFGWYRLAVAAVIVVLIGY